MNNFLSASLSYSVLGRKCFELVLCVCCAGWYGGMMGCGLVVSGIGQYDGRLWYSVALYGVILCVWLYGSPVCFVLIWFCKMWYV